MRSRAEDFRVSEVLGWQPAGVGEHLLVNLEKTGDNTDYLARHLADIAGCRVMDIGYCGLKDRHAVTRQWFSVPCPASRESEILRRLDERWCVLASARHERKLRRGQHRANRFEIVLRDLQIDDLRFRAGFQRVAESGCPNYFGRQRFGRDGGNLSKAMALKPQQLNNRKARANAGMYLSAARALMFNDWLGRRVAMGDWRDPWPGDPEPVASGPLFGDDACGAGEPLCAQELAFAEGYPHFMALLRQTRMKPGRRALVLKPVNCSLTLEGSQATLTFELPAGAFATAVLQELLDIEDTVSRL